MTGFPLQSRDVLFNPFSRQTVLSVRSPADLRRFQIASLPASPAKSSCDCATDCSSSSASPQSPSRLWTPQGCSTFGLPCAPPASGLLFMHNMHCIHPDCVAFHFTWSITLHRKIQTCIRSISQSSVLKKKKNHSEGKCQRIFIVFIPRSPKFINRESIPVECSSLVPHRSQTLYSPAGSVTVLSTVFH